MLIILPVILIALIFIFVDLDGDGLSNIDELKYGTNLLNPDTDNDGLKDGAEVKIYSTNPKLADTDGDGLDDGKEVNVYSTNPLSPDTDNDGLNDRQEVVILKTNPVNPDTDNDGFNDKEDLYPLFDYGILVNITNWKELEKADGDKCGDLSLEVDAEQVPNDIISFSPEGGILYDTKTFCADSKIYSGYMIDIGKLCEASNLLKVVLNVPDNETFIKILVKAFDIDTVSVPSPIPGYGNYSVLEKYDINPAANVTNGCELYRVNSSLYSYSTAGIEMFGCPYERQYCYPGLDGYNAILKMEIYNVNFSEMCPGSLFGACKIG